MNEPASPELDDAAFEAELAANRRRGRLISVAVAVSAVLIGVTAFVLTRPALPPLPADEVEEIREALPMMNQYPDMARGFAGAALEELEVERLPAAIIEALGDLRSVPPGMEGMICAKAMAEPEVLEMFVAVCPEGPDLLAQALQSGDRSSLVSGCDAEGQPLSAADAQAGAPGCVALSLTIWGYLRGKRAEEEIERTLLRMMVTGR